MNKKLSRLTKVVYRGEFCYVVAQKPDEYYLLERPGKSKMWVKRSDIEKVLINGEDYANGAKVISTTDHCNRCGGSMKLGHTTTIVEVIRGEKFEVNTCGLECSNQRRWIGCPLCFDPVVVSRIGVVLASIARRRKKRQLRTDL